MGKGIKTSSVYFYIMVITLNNIKTPICVFYRMVRILFCLFTCVFLTDLDAQKYITAGGTRLGEDIGISIQQRIAKHLTFLLLEVLNSHLTDSMSHGIFCLHLVFGMVKNHLIHQLH